MDDVEKVKQRIDITDIIGEHIALKKTGRNFHALCPFHGEKSPSFIVSPDRQIWHCFGCGRGSDVFGFLMEYEKIDFSEALKILAERAGIKLTTSVFKTGQEKRKDLIYTLNSLAAQFYHFLLTKHPAGKQALLYLLETRKIPEGLIEKFNLGFAPNKSSLLITYLIKKKGYSHSDLLEAGLATKINGKVVDFFRRRVIFPIHDARGNTIAFSGRALDDKTLPKYVNTRETLVYKKGDTLFGLFQAKDSIKREGKVILVEGEFDVISAFHEGITNIVAVKGTALTESQVRVLKRFAPKIAFCFDTDPAGTAAQRRSIELIEKEGISATVIIPPKGKDPDELLKEDPIAFKKAIKEDVNIYDFIIDTSIAGANPGTAEGKAHILAKALPFLSVIENEVVKEYYLKKLAHILDTSLDSIIKQADKITRPQAPAALTPHPERKKSREEVLEEYLLSLLLQSKNPAQYSGQVSAFFENISLSISSHQRIFKFLIDFLSTQKEFAINEFAKTLPPELIETFDRCFLSPISELKTEEEYAQEVEKTAKEVKLLSVKNVLKMLSKEIREKEIAGDEEELEKLRLKFQEYAQLLK